MMKLPPRPRYTNREAVISSRDQTTYHDHWPMSASTSMAQWALEKRFSPAATGNKRVFSTGGRVQFQRSAS